MFHAPLHLLDLDYSPQINRAQEYMDLKVPDLQGNLVLTVNKSNTFCARTVTTIYSPYPFSRHASSSVPNAPIITG